MKFNPLKYVNRYKIRNAMPGMLTATACIGVIMTGITSARAMKKYLEATDEPCDHTVEAIKAAVLPSVIGAGTIASFIFARKADKAVIAGLSAAVASLSSQIHNTNEAIREAHKDDKETAERIIRRKKHNDPDVLVIDPDGDLYSDESTGINMRVRSETLQNARYKLNRNYHIRGGIASLYEFYRFLGVTKAEIAEWGIDWIRYVGWHAEYLENDCISWIDSFEDISDFGYHVIGFHYPPVPICCDPPVFVMDRCHCNVEDIIDLQSADSICSEIASEILDNYEE